MKRTDFRLEKGTMIAKERSSAGGKASGIHPTRQIRHFK
jgi:hypothetical protein